jgi:DNA-binding NarL/FixJ family response regulator
MQDRADATNAAADLTRQWHRLRVRLPPPAADHGARFPSRSRGTPRQPAAILTDSEMSVLRFLPSHLTSAGIGRECFLSVNTIKVYMRSIYAKLGTSPRAEAVERARLLGLL